MCLMGMGFILFLEFTPIVGVVALGFPVSHAENECILDLLAGLAGTRAPGIRFGFGIIECILDLLAGLAAMACGKPESVAPFLRQMPP